MAQGANAEIGAIKPYRPNLLAVIDDTLILEKDHYTLHDFLERYVCSFIAILAALCVLTSPVECISARFFCTLGPEVRYVRGNSTYHISFDNPWAAGGHGESELEFPLDNFMAGLHIVAGTRRESAGGQTRDRLSVSWLGVVDGDAGIMKNSDRVENDAAFGETPHEGKDLYTESDARLRGAIIDAN